MLNTPPELIADIEAFERRWEDSALRDWRRQMPDQFSRSMSEKRFGDLPRWRAALAALPSLKAETIDLDTNAITASGQVDDGTRRELEDALRSLHPWRKGPFSLFGVDIDTEWRSDFKWDRLSGAIDPLEGRRVLDVGCGSGYHCWRMKGAGAAEVIGIDPTPLFVLQFKAIQHYLNIDSVHVLPLALEQLPPKLKSFDTTFSMGVLYHRRSPMDHLTDLRDTLAPGGQLVLETLVVEGGEDTVFVPPDRYARMGNVWFLPSPAALMKWMSKTGFIDVELVDLNQTTVAEQRSTEWMTFYSLSNFLDSNDHNKTVEGHPAPRRAIITARLP
ncbi:MAG: tRNA 5-methoxyuridine(34)/uridine 5-oxyacetic acid(34) synthase CmoB [Gammaproteobacteria bacterium]|nr:tRNA 5-methoxyuridine(34)/uridine 5-oxyacetic acid(34) synthase CmoB [Gammaproteobacteria bacterium]